VERAAYMTMGAGKPDIALATITRRAPSGATTETLYAVEADQAGAQILPDWSVVRTGENGVTRIVSASGSAA
jgi:hypothetical protein